MPLFGTSGIRGKYLDKITPELAMEVGKAIGTYMQKGRIAIARDTRTTGQILEAAIISGILSTGAKVLKIGCATTPTLAIAVRNHADAGIMITASHNPAEYNGIKLWQKNGMAFLPAQEKEIERIIEKKTYEKAAWNEIHQTEKMDCTREHMQLILENVQLKKPLKIVVDCASGPASLITPYLFREMGCKVTAINSQLDGSFPGRKPEPNQENLKDLIAIVKATGADLGIAHDGDADRAVAVDKYGMIPLDKQLALAIEYYLSKEKGKIVTTEDASMSIEETAEKYNGKIIRVRVGDVAVAEGIEKNKAIFGGEPCGAWIHPKISLCPDGPLTAAILAAVASEGDIQERLKKIKTYPMEREKLKCKEQEKNRILDKMREKIKELNPEKISRIDGIRAEWKDMWALIRPSGTEPIIRITAEGKDREKLKKRVEEIKKMIQKEAKC